MKYKELKQKPEKELRNLLQGYRSKLFELKINLSQGQVKNTAEVKKIKGVIARILTVLNSKV